MDSIKHCESLDLTQLNPNPGSYSRHNWRPDQELDRPEDPECNDAHRLDPLEYLRYDEPYEGGRLPVPYEGGRHRLSVNILPQEGSIKTHSIALARTPRQ